MYVEVTVFDSVAVSITEDLELCENEEAILEAGGGSSYLWSTGDTTNMITIIGADTETYGVTVTDVNGCNSIDSVDVAVNELADTTFLELTTCDSLAAGIFEFVIEDQNECDSVVVENIYWLPISRNANCTRRFSNSTKRNHLFS